MIAAPACAKLASARRAGAGLLWFICAHALVLHRHQRSGAAAHAAETLTLRLCSSEWLGVTVAPSAAAFRSINSALLEINLRSLEFAELV